MKVLLFTILTLTVFTDPGKIGQINTLKSEARKAFNAGDFQTAASKYRMLKDSLAVSEDEINLNLAHAYYQLRDSAQAISTYQEAAASSNNTIRSKANQQLGLINNQQGKFEEALNNFKQAIKADPNNMDARYNYEMLKKKLEKKKQEEQKKQDQKQNDQQKNNEDQKKEDQKKEEQNKQDKKKSEQEKKEDQKKSENKDEQSKEEKKDDQQKKDEQEKDSEKPSEEKKETPPSVSEKLQQMKISEEKAKMLLEAMKNQEVQYLQQNKRKATKPKEKGKPDW